MSPPAVRTGHMPSVYSDLFPLSVYSDLYPASGYTAEETRKAVSDIAERTDDEMVCGPLLMRRFDQTRFLYFMGMAFQESIQSGVLVFSRVHDLVDAFSSSPEFIFTPEGFARLSDDIEFLRGSDPRVAALVMLAAPDMGP